MQKHALCIEALNQAIALQPTTLPGLIEKAKFLMSIGRNSRSSSRRNNGGSNHNYDIRVRDVILMVVLEDLVVAVLILVAG